MLKRILIGIVLGLLPSIAIAETHLFHHESVLGTSMELRVEAQTMKQAKEVESTVLLEVDRVALIVSAGILLTFVAYLTLVPK